MAENSSIEWTDHTFNPWLGCTKVGPGCDHCYAEAMMDRRHGRVRWGSGNPRVRTSEETWKGPVRWNKAYQREMDRARNAILAFAPSRPRVFCASLADVFDNEVPPAWRADLFRLIEATPNLDWLLLTKRIGNAPGMLRETARMLEWPYVDVMPVGVPPNVWLGATVVNQQEADRDIPKLLDVPARVRFLSIEPMLGPVNVSGLLMRDVYRGDSVSGFMDYDAIDWVICGGESGPYARPMHPDWARSLRDQCQAAGVPFFFKQWGQHSPEGLRVGKRAAGRLLDGREWSETP